MATVATLKRKIQKMWTGEVSKLVKDSLGTGLPRVNFHECLSYLLSNKSVKHNTTDSSIDYNFNVFEETENGNLKESTDEVHTLLNYKLNENLDGSPTAPLLVDNKELETLIMATIATLKRKIQKMWTGKVFKLVKDLLRTGLSRVNFHEYLGYLLSKKSVKDNTTDSSINYNFNIVEETENANLKQSTDEVHTLSNYKLK